MSLPTLTGIETSTPPLASSPSTDRAELEQRAITGYQTGELSLYEVRIMLGFDNRWDTEEWLGSRGVEWNYSMEDLLIDRETIKHLLGE